MQNQSNREITLDALKPLQRNSFVVILNVAQGIEGMAGEDGETGTTGLKVVIIIIIFLNFFLL